MKVDPKANGFNYGIGWGTTPKPAVYYLAEMVARELRQESQRVSAEAWALDHAIRAVRLAESEIEKQMALDRLRNELVKHEEDIREAAE